ncbi:MAG: toxic anion resistance protein [Candidatus Limnocylindrales bacterium]
MLKEDMLFSVRQKHQDLLTQLAVSVQGYLALDVIRRNNLELIKGVQRATTTTVSALRTAVIVARALADQKLVLDQITALNTTTSNLIESTSEMLRHQSGQINEQAAVRDDRPGQAPGGIRQHLRDDGRDRHVQGPRPRHDAEDGHRAVGRDHEVPGVSRPGPDPRDPGQRDRRPRRTEPLGPAPR